MFGAMLKATNSSFQKGMTFCRSLYVKKAMKLLAFIFEQSSYYCTCIYFYGNRNSLTISKLSLNCSGSMTRLCVI